MAIELGKLLRLNRIIVRRAGICENSRQYQKLQILDIRGTTHNAVAFHIGAVFQHVMEQRAEALGEKHN
jgi:hypothetical protein